MDALSHVVEALPQALRTHKVVLAAKEWGGVRLVRRFSRIATGHNRQLISNYLAGNAVRKLHLGCGHHRLAGWLNCDIEPMRDAIMLDATRPFPFAGDTFDFIYCEHMIEHVPYAGGRAMLAEAHRVLKPGGTLRIATPDVRFLLRLYRDDRSVVETEYIAWSSARYLGDAAPHTALGVINNFVRDWGHTFIYDQDGLRQSLERVGFVEITPMNVGQSGKPPLEGLENAGRMPANYYELETFVLEATK